MSDPDFRTLYPELIPPKRLAPLLQQALAEIASPAVVEDPLGASYACLAIESRSCQIMVAARERNFHTDFWRKGVLYGGLWDPDIRTIARAVHEFLVDRADLARLGCEFSQAEIPQAAYAHERGRLVDFTWSHWLNGEWNQWPENMVKQVLDVAAAYPRLRVLLPYTSLNRVCFSATTGFPYTHDCPVIELLEDGTCVVYESGPCENMTKIYSGPTLQSVATAATALSDSVGVARDGTANDVALDT